MTDIQVKYWTNKESQRHNREMEKLGYVQQREAERHNRAMEQVSALQAATAARNVNVQERNIAMQEQMLPSNILLNEARTYQSTRQGDVLHEQVIGARADAKVKKAAAWYADVNTGIGFIDSLVKTVGNVIATFDNFFD